MGTSRILQGNPIGEPAVGNFAKRFPEFPAVQGSDTADAVIRIPSRQRRGGTVDFRDQLSLQSSGIRLVGKPDVMYNGKNRGKRITRGIRHGHAVISRFFRRERKLPDRIGTGGNGDGKRISGYGFAVRCIHRHGTGLRPFRRTRIVKPDAERGLFSGDRGKIQHKRRQRSPLHILFHDFVRRQRIPVKTHSGNRALER